MFFPSKSKYKVKNNFPGKGKGEKGRSFLLCCQCAERLGVLCEKEPGYMVGECAGKSGEVLFSTSSVTGWPHVLNKSHLPSDLSFSIFEWIGDLSHCLTPGS